MLCACDTQSSVASICSLAPASLKLAARQSSPPALNNPECSGPYEVPTHFSLFGVAVLTAALKIIGKRAAPPDFHFYVAHPTGCSTGKTRLSQKNEPVGNLFPISALPPRIAARYDRRRNSAHARSLCPLL